MFLQAVIIESRHELPDDVEAEKLSGFVELGMLDLRQVQLPVHLVQQVLLDDLVHHDGDKQVEEDGGQVLQAWVVEGNFMYAWRSHVDGHRYIVMQRDEEWRKGRRHLEHETNDEDHGDAGHDIGVVLQKRNRFLFKQMIESSRGGLEVEQWSGNRTLYLSGSIPASLGACVIVWYQWTRYVMYVLDVWYNS